MSASVTESPTSIAVATDDEAIANALHLFASLVPDEFQLSRLQRPDQDSNLGPTP